MLRHRLALAYISTTCTSFEMTSTSDQSVLEKHTDFQARRPNKKMSSDPHWATQEASCKGSTLDVWRRRSGLALIVSLVTCKNCRCASTAKSTTKALRHPSHQMDNITTSHPSRTRERLLPQCIVTVNCTLERRKELCHKKTSCIVQIFVHNLPKKAITTKISAFIIAECPEATRAAGISQNPD